LGEPDFACDSADAIGNLYDCEGYRLPNEAEWEYAARAGTRSPFYLGTFAHPVPGVPGPEPALAPAAWYNFNSGTSTHPRGQKVSNAWGLFDILGNAAEWVNEPPTSSGYGVGPLTDPGPFLVSSTKRKRRGGDFVTANTACTVTSQFEAESAWNGPGTGFRLARTLPKP
jgi:formylglycine-generating enzyme required for sulfatase activity